MPYTTLPVRIVTIKLKKNIYNWTSKCGPYNLSTLNQSPRLGGHNLIVRKNILQEDSHSPKLRHI